MHLPAAMCSFIPLAQPRKAVVPLVTFIGLVHLRCCSTFSSFVELGAAIKVKSMIESCFMAMPRFLGWAFTLSWAKICEAGDLGACRTLRCHQEALTELL